MKNMKTILKIALLLSLLLALSACGSDVMAELQQEQQAQPAGEEPLAVNAEPTAVDPVAIFTSAAATVGAQMTQTAASFSPTPPPPTATQVVQPTATLIQLNAATATTDPAFAQSTATLGVGVVPTIPTATAVAIVNTPAGTPCNAMNYGTPLDINYEDYSVVPAGNEFYKIWRITNTGTCTWDDGYVLVPVGSEIMAGSRTNDLNPLDALNPAFKITSLVAPGQNVDVGAKLSAPLTNGTYATHFVMADDQGTYFGGVLTVIIKVEDGTD